MMGEANMSYDDFITEVDSVVSEEDFVRVYTEYAKMYGVVSGYKYLVDDYNREEPVRNLQELFDKLFTIYGEPAVPCMYTFFLKLKYGKIFQPLHNVGIQGVEEFLEVSNKVLNNLKNAERYSRVAEQFLKFSRDEISKLEGVRVKLQVEEIRDSINYKRGTKYTVPLDIYGTDEKKC